MVRTLKTKLPAAPGVLQPQMPCNVLEQLNQQQRQEKHYHDQGARPSRSMPRRSGPSAKGKRMGTRRSDKAARHSAVVRDKHHGKVLRRNRRHLNPSPEPLSELSEGLDYNSDNVDNDDTSLGDPSGTVQQGQKLPTSPKVARSGREIRKPARLKDYVIC
ncbi:uncharacterized protein LOC134193977 [Corticium candelabrum]|uniref:uncharacterized protein LOC134193977 n=1 Tax=Corticium candelabrum TaxID=121492 RepID=UPI002E26B61E|nr:uncharacterized protein LOC134193977 [Corticium candelabrum]